MIRRYTLPEMADLFSEHARWQMLLEVEVLATEARAKLGEVPANHATACRARMPQIDDSLIADIDAREAITDHDLAAFVDVVQERIGAPEGNWIHYGLTSTDVIDTAQCALLVRAADLLLRASDSLIGVLKRRAIEFRDTACVGRTHGIHAEPTTFGRKLALWALQCDRDRRRLRQARETIAVGKLSGAVGTFSNIDPEVEAYVCQALGLQPVPATQVVARDRHAELLYACAAVGTTMELIGTEIRHLQRTEVGEAAEGFAPGQKGSSAMPHKRNPITAERLCGLARTVRGYLIPALENVALWHERDISHSSSERVILADAISLTYYVLKLATKTLDRLDVFPDRMLENLDRSYGLVFSQPVLLALVEGGLTRDDAYRIVQRDARKAFEERRPFRSVLEEDADVTLEAERLDHAFSLEWSLRNISSTFEALNEIQ